MGRDQSSPSTASGRRGVSGVDLLLAEVLDRKIDQELSLFQRLLVGYCVLRTLVYSSTVSRKNLAETRSLVALPYVLTGGLLVGACEVDLGVE